MDNNQEAFVALLRGGLWGKEVQFAPYTDLDFKEIYRLAQEQSVVGLVAVGIETLQSPRFKIQGIPPIHQMIALTIAGEVFQLEQRNRAMNKFVARLVADMRTEGIDALLVKGQGIAQCYEKPEWRTCGDVDLFLSENNYAKAKELLVPLATSVEEEYVREKHLGMTIDGWVVELHGRLYCGLSSRIERELDDIYVDTFNGGNVRSWNNNGVQVFQLGVENDVFYVFTHILQHFYKEGVGLRQVCDWCRLLYTYRDSLNYGLLEQRIKRAGLMSEWKAFYNLASRYLGMPDFGSGLMIHDSRFDKKADKICEFILVVGNFGHNRERTASKSYMGGKLASTCKQSFRSGRDILKFR